MNTLGFMGYLKDAWRRGLQFPRKEELILGIAAAEFLTDRLVRSRFASFPSTQRVPGRKHTSHPVQQEKDSASFSIIAIVTFIHDNTMTG